ncbi:hypothetical protein V8G54_032480 [Vigna mungo]|uniref:FAD synthase n=1 Tax=Vigna mungo TaxID=3915 RepID=A0AAQ3MLI2_VIGMU
MSEKSVAGSMPDDKITEGGVVALGKFDALHIGHRELAIQASKAGPPFLLSFVGMDKVLGHCLNPENNLSTYRGKSVYIYPPKAPFDERDCVLDDPSNNLFHNVMVPTLWLGGHRFSHGKSPFNCGGR